jgi:hypothetical protein
MLVVMIPLRPFQLLVIALGLLAPTVLNTRLGPSRPALGHCCCLCVIRNVLRQDPMALFGVQHRREAF